MISVSGLKKSFGDVLALDDLSFTVESSEIVGLLGPNGAGKTTTMRIMSGFLSSDEGDVNIDGVSVLDCPVEAQQVIGYLPENNPLYKDMLVSDLLVLSGELKMLNRAQIREALDFVVPAVKINNVFNRPVGTLSKGYKQRVGLAVALFHKPKILILDEPTEGLDPVQRTEIRALIKELAKERTVIISTHVMQEVEALCSRIILIDKGKKIADGSMDSLVNDRQGGRVIEFDIEGADVENKLEKLQGVEKTGYEKLKNGHVSGSFRLTGRESLQPQISKLARDNGWTIWKISEKKQHLEEVFRELTGL